MKMQSNLLLVAALLFAAHASAGPVVGLTTFTAGTPARAGEVNSNFGAVRTAVDDNNTRIGTLLTQLAALQASVTTLQTQSTAQQAQIATLQSTATTLQSQVATLTTSNATLQTSVATLTASNATLQSQLTNITPLNGVMSLSSIGGMPTVRFTNVNVQVINGQGSTATSNGTGNLLIGYDAVRTTGTSICSLGTNPTTLAHVTDQPSCTAAGGTWALNHKSGSHNLIVGDRHNYSRWGGVVFGAGNTSNYNSASVTGGQNNVASGSLSSVSGGNGNQATAQVSSVSGGAGNTASHTASSVSGGSSNTASGVQSSVSGGSSRSATTINSWTAGGLTEAN